MAHRISFGLSLFFLILLAVVPVAAEDIPSIQVSSSGSLNSLESALGLHFFGDVRFRFKYMVQGQDYAPTFDASTPLWIDHELNYRIRARLGVEKTFSQDAKAGLCFITSGKGDPTDPYWTLSGGATFVNVGLDLAYIDWTPGFLDHRLTISLGKIENPLLYSPITWDENVMPEGIGINASLASGTGVNLLYFRLQDNGPATIEGAGADPFMFDLQVQQKIDLSDAQMILMAGYQYISNTAAFQTNDSGLTSYLSDPTNPPGAPLSITYKGMVGDGTNGGQIPEMHVLEGMVRVSHTIGEEKIPVLWTLHAALNLSSFPIDASTNANVLLNNPGLNDTNNLALLADLRVGKVDHWGDWAGELQWGYIDPDAVFSAFNTPDPGTGHNNNTWFMGQVEMGLDKGLDLTLSQYADWRTDYAVFATQPSNVFGTTSRDPMLKILADVTAKF